MSKKPKIKFKKDIHKLIEVGNKVFLEEAGFLRDSNPHNRIHKDYCDMAWMPQKHILKKMREAMDKVEENN